MAIQHRVTSRPHPTDTPVQPKIPAASRNTGGFPRLTAERHTDRDWHTSYATRLIFTDLLVLIWVVFGVQIAWFGVDSVDVRFRGHIDNLVVSYSAVSLILIFGWTLLLGIFGTRESRVLGTGPSEYKLIGNASFALFGILAIIAFLFHIDVARGYVLIAFPLGVVLLVLSRWMWRQWLVLQRMRGRYTSRVILVGSHASALRIADELASAPGAGYLVVGACIPGGRTGQTGHTLTEAHTNTPAIPILGDIDDLHAALDLTRSDTVVITSGDDLSQKRMRELSWSLEPGRHHLVVVPRLIDIGGPRIHTRPVAGLPLIHVETPRYEGRKLFLKRAFDILTSTLLIIVCSPLLVVIALGVRLTSPGTVLFRQERIGINGRPFNMLKFRSMVTDAESLLAGLQHHSDPTGTANDVLFKMKSDPRITPIGRLLRRFSLDELPQFFNVFGGSMSLVGPRPSLERESSKYESHVHRRFLVKPGITGLWQVSGRSDLSWEDSVRLDLYYVENWSITGDLIILWRTAAAVLKSDGAY